MKKYALNLALVATFASQATITHEYRIPKKVLSIPKNLSKIAAGAACLYESYTYGCQTRGYVNLENGFTVAEPMELGKAIGVSGGTFVAGLYAIYEGCKGVVENVRTSK